MNMLLSESQYIMQLCIIILLCWLGWLCDLAFGQLAEAFTASSNFSNIQLTCLANLAAFFTFLFRGQLWCQDQAELGLATQKTEKLKNINGLEVLTTWSENLQECSVDFLSFQMPISRSMRLLMSYMSNVYHVHSIFLHCCPLRSVTVTDTLMYLQVHTRMHCIHESRCICIVFKTVEDITMMLAHRMPGTVTRLSDSVSLLPSLRCLRNGCHGCNRGLFHVDNDKLREGDSPAAACEILDLESIHTVGTCIVIPVHSAKDDEWTKQLITFFDPGDKELRGAVVRNSRTNASSALQNYINGNGECNADENYKVASLFILPRLSKLFIQLLLTFWLKVDGFYSSLFAFVALQNYISVRDYMLSPHWFLSRALVKSNANECQVLFCAGAPRYALSYILDDCVSIICVVSWMVLVATDGDSNRWYLHTHSMPPSTPRVAVILAGICIALVMDGLDLCLYLKTGRMRSYDWIYTLMIGTIIFEILCIVVCSAISDGYGYRYIGVTLFGINTNGGWIYGTLQGLAAVKFVIGLLIIPHTYRYGEPNWWYGSCGMYINASGILLNAILAGVRAEWKFE